MTERKQTGTAAGPGGGAAGPGGGAAAEPLATIVIVNWNGAHLLPACLDGIAKQDAGFAFQTWVVDNASADGSRELLAERYPWVRVVPSDRNLGFAGGNNLALRQVTTPYAVL
ncbi:glycosyltransferase, partial [Frankia sp. AvcI1]